MAESLPQFPAEDAIKELAGGALSFSDVESIVSRLDPQPLTYPAGAIIFNQGDEGDAMYFLVQGRVEVTYKDPDKDINNILRIRILTAPDVVGEMALVHNQPRSATVTSLGDFFYRLSRDRGSPVISSGDALLYRLSRDNWRAVEESQPDMASMASEIKKMAGRRAIELELAISIAKDLNP